MKKEIILLSIFVPLCILPGICNAQAQAKTSPLFLSGTIELTNVSGRIDHLTYDSTNKFLFVAALGNNSVEVVDLKTKEIIHSFKDLNEPQGIAFIPESNSLFVANGGNGECTVFNVATHQKTNSILLGDDADNVRYDSNTKKIFVGYASGGIAIIDAKNFKLVNEIKLSGHPESFQLDKTTNKIFVNVPDEKQIEVIDLMQNKVVSRWKLKEASSNFPMALDGMHHRLFIGCRHPAKLVVLDTESGKTISSIDISNDVDDIFYNASSKEIYCSCGGGSVDIISQTDANTYSGATRAESKSGARTSLFIPELNQLIVASPATISRKATLLIYSIKK